MPAPSHPEFSYFDFTSIDEAARALFSRASTPDEAAALRDEVLVRIAEGANDARRRIAEAAERAASSEEGESAAADGADW